MPFWNGNKRITEFNVNCFKWELITKMLEFTVKQATERSQNTPNNIENILIQK